MSEIQLIWLPEHIAVSRRIWFSWLLFLIVVVFRGVIARYRKTISVWEACSLVVFISSQWENHGCLLTCQQLRITPLNWKQMYSRAEQSFSGWNSHVRSHTSLKNWHGEFQRGKGGYGVPQVSYNRAVRARTWLVFLHSLIVFVVRR